MRQAEGEIRYWRDTKTELGQLGQAEPCRHMGETGEEGCSCLSGRSGRPLWEVIAWESRGRLNSL